jgi:hypothetical protein
MRVSLDRPLCHLSLLLVARIHSCSLAPSFFDAFPHARARAHTHTLTHSLTHSLTHTLIHSRHHHHFHHHHHTIIHISVALVRKSSQTWQAINLAVMYTGSYYSQLINGDGDVFRLAWLALGTPFHTVAQLPSLVGTFKEHYGSKQTSYCGHATLNYATDGTPLWLHTRLKNKLLLKPGTRA